MLYQIKNVHTFCVCENSIKDDYEEICVFSNKKSIIWLFTI